MLIVVNSLDLSYVARHCHRQFAGRIHLTGQHLGDSLSTHLTWLPGVQNGVGILFSPTDAECPAGHQHDNGRLAGSHDGLQKLLLHPRKAEVVTIAVLTAGATES